MNIRGIRLKVSQLHAVHKLNTPRHLSIQDFMENVLDDSDTLYDIAAKTIIYFGVEDGKYNKCQGGIRIALGLLADCTSCQVTATVANDLKSVLESPTHESLKRWAESHFR